MDVKCQFYHDVAIDALCDIQREQGATGDHADHAGWARDFFPTMLPALRTIDEAGEVRAGASEEEFQLMLFLIVLWVAAFIAECHKMYTESKLHSPAIELA